MIAHDPSRSSNMQGSTLRHRRFRLAATQLLTISASMLICICTCVGLLLWFSTLPPWVWWLVLSLIATCTGACMCIFAFLASSIRVVVTMIAPESRYCAFLPADLFDVFTRLYSTPKATTSPNPITSDDQDQRLRSPMQLWRCFLHELGVPLHALSWGFDFILHDQDKGGASLSSEHIQVLSEMREQVGVMHHVLLNARATDELLHSSVEAQARRRSPPHTPPASLESIDLENLVSTTASLYFAKAHAFRCDLHTDIQQLQQVVQQVLQAQHLKWPRDTTSCFVRGDAKLLRRILAHLFSFTMNHDSRVVVRLVYEQVTLLVADEDAVCGGALVAHIRVTESGPCARTDEVEALKLLFQAPYDMSTCVDMNHPIQGLRGMGLRLCSDLLQSQGGTIQCESDPSQSSVVYQITLPLQLEFSSRALPLTPGPLSRSLLPSLHTIPELAVSMETAWNTLGVQVEMPSSDHQLHPRGYPEHSPAADLTSALESSSVLPTSSPSSDVPRACVASVVSSSRSQLQCHILIVEDHTVTQRLMKRLLKLKNMTSEVADNGQACLDRMGRVDLPGFDAILMDGSMPILNGVCTVRALRLNGVTLPVIGVTANSLDADIQAFLSAGADAVLTKPVEIDTLLATLKRVLRDRMQVQ